MKSRIFLKYKNVLKEFYWVEIRKDGSIYFGASDTKGVKEASRGTTTFNSSESGVVELNTGTALEEKEINGKHSFHASGVIIHPHYDGEYRERMKIEKLEEYGEPLPLISIFPLHGEKYKTTEKQIKDTDIIINTKEFLPNSFALFLYIKLPSMPCFEKHESWSIFRTLSVPLDQYELCAGIYTDKSKFSTWPEFEVECIAQPNNVGKFELVYFDAN